MSFLDEFKEFRKILCVCPCCGEIVRVSDLHIKYKGPSQKTWLDSFEEEVKKIERKEQKFDEIASDIRKKSVNKGRIDAEKAVIKMMSKGMKTLKIDPFDVKAISNPVDFVVFDGMTKEKMKEVMFLSNKINNNEINKKREQVKKAISQNKYDWKVVRINDSGEVSIE
jgi:predicted Holliday junction resolvase-like endonuclease